jgi:hypothetical protein
LRLYIASDSKTPQQQVKPEKTGTGRKHKQRLEKVDTKGKVLALLNELRRVLCSATKLCYDDLAETK